MTIRIGQKSIGLTNSLRQPVTLPPLNLSVDQRIADILNKMEDLTIAVNLKADQDKLRTLIAYSKEAIFLQAENIALMGDITIGKIISEQNGSSSGELPIQITRIIGNMVQTGSIQSNNWSGTEGTRINLDDSTITMGGSNDPSFYYDGVGNLTISGTLTANTIVSGTGQTLGGMVSNISTSLSSIYTDNDARNLLASGVGNVIAGTTGDFTLSVENTFVAAQHKDANPSGLGAGYTGTLRTGLVLTANGLAMGYNDKTTGAWINSIAIDGTTGAGIFSGSLSGASGSFVGALVGATGTFSGSLSAATGTFSGSLSAASGSFAGTVTGGSIVSTNWGASEGTNINLNTSVITLGGSSNPSLYYDGAGNLTISGTLASSSIVSGTGTNLATVASNAQAGASGVAGLGALATQNAVNLSTQITGLLSNTAISGLGALSTQSQINLATQTFGSLPNSSVSGLGALALLGSVNLSTTQVVGSLAANRIGVGTLAAGVVYAGTVSASNITSGTISAGVIYAGSLSGATGTFSGDLSSAGGTFSGNLSAAGGTFSGSLSAATGTFSGSISAATGNFSGALITSGVVSATGGNNVGSFTAAIHAIPTAGGAAYYGRSFTTSPTAQFSNNSSGFGALAESVSGTGAFGSGGQAGVWGVGSGTGRGVVGQASSAENVAVDVFFGRLQIASNRITKSQVADHFIDVYDVAGVFIASYRYAFR
jgi:hypothetical protein